MERSKTLYELAETVGGSVTGAGETLIADVTHDSRAVAGGTLFVALRGANNDGHDFVSVAVRSGAAAVCVEREVDTPIPQLVVADTRRVLGELAAAVHGYPSNSLAVVGVTGTNGKTTVSHYVESLLALDGARTGLIGTISTKILGEAEPSERTTPEASDFQRLLAKMRDLGVETVAVEVSSHALELGRVNGTTFAVAAFTNLSQDHLDFHGTMDAYRAAKERLFFDYNVGTAVVNIDDATGAALAPRLRDSAVTVGAGGDYEAAEIAAREGGVTFTLHSPMGPRQVSAPVMGEFNVTNLATAIACCVAVGADLDRILANIDGLSPVPGRFEVVDDEGPTVIVDYAHTPEGITKAIETARMIGGGNVIAVCGAGGDRDDKKRSLMGAAASAADLVVLTSDNPRSEDPDTIISQVAEGVTAPLVRQLDRRAAIAEALSLAERNDIVLILGKGHEQGQETAGKVRPFDDRDVAREELIRLRKSASSGMDSGSMSQ